MDGDVLFAVSAIGAFTCIETATGKIRWTKQLKQEFGGTQPGWGYSESPLVDGNLVVCTPGGARGTILAFNKSNGEVVWRSTDFKDGAQYAGLVPATWADAASGRPPGKKMSRPATIWSASLNWLELTTACNSTP